MFYQAFVLAHEKDDIHAKMTRISNCTARVNLSNIDCSCFHRAMHKPSACIDAGDSGVSSGTRCSSWNALITLTHYH